MKPIKSILRSLPIVAFALLAAPGCISLDEDLRGQPTADKLFTDAASFDKYIKGAYPYLVILYGTDVPFVAGAAAEDVKVPNWVPRWKGFETADINTVSVPDELTEMLWDNHYQSIGVCNSTLVSTVEAGIDPEEVKAVTGEAKFIRALCYFNLTRWFKQVPLITEDNQTGAASEPDASVEAIYAQIISDLNDAEAKLPATRTDKTRPVSLAATALLAKVYLTMAGYPLNQTQYFASARDKAWAVIDSKKYDLEPEFFDLWLYDNRMTNSEFIFAFYSNYDTDPAGMKSYINCAVRPSEHGEKGWCDWTSDKRFLATYPQGDGSRVRGTFYLTLLDGTSWEDTNEKQPFVSKWRDGGPLSGGYAGPPSQGNASSMFPYIRFADILLVYAEAANKAEGSPSTEAYKAVNRVRGRAGLGNLSGLNQTTFHQAVIDERNWELVHECNRWADICRLQLLQEVMNEYYPERVIDDHNYWMPKPYNRLDIWTGTVQNDGY